MSSLIEDAEALFLTDGEVEEIRAILVQISDLQKTIAHFGARRRAHEGIADMHAEIATHTTVAETLERAFSLAWHLKATELATTLYHQAFEHIKSDPRGITPQQERSLAVSWMQLTVPWWRRPFQVFHKLFSAVGEYEIQKQHPGL